MKKYFKLISSFFAILTLIFGLLLVPPIQDFAYSKTMDLLSEDCKKTVTINGSRAFGACWGNNGTCKTETIEGPCDVILE